MQQTTPIDETEASSVPGWLALIVWLTLMALLIWREIVAITGSAGAPDLWAFVAVPALVFLLKGFNILQPNIAGVFTFFGRYAGSLREGGFYWVNPLYARQKVSLRVHNLNSPTLKVNDRAGNPIEVAAVVVWKVADTARAVFDVEDYGSYVAIQAESALRAVASSRWYDGDAHGEHSLRADLDAVARTLQETLQTHVLLAGVEVLDARISHLAYAPEIAGVMLRRQQAEAVVAARTRIVEGAVSMVQLAIHALEAAEVAKLGDDDRVRLVTNLMTVLVGESDAQPVVQLGKAP